MKRSEKEISFNEFENYSCRFNAVPLVREIPLAKKSPFEIYRQIAGEGGFSLLLESGISRHNEGRFSFIAAKPERIFTLTNGTFREEGPKGKLLRSGAPKLFGQAIEEYISSHRNELFEGLPPFCGGVAGYLGYEMVQYWEKLFHKDPKKRLKESFCPEAIMMGFRSVIAIDHLYEKVFLIETVSIPEGANPSAKKALYNKGLFSLEELERKVLAAKSSVELDGTAEAEAAFCPNMTKSCFLSMVEEAKERIRSGDICQVVLSQRFSAQKKVSPLRLYQALKLANPSPYMFLLDLKSFRLIGSSPEVLVRVEGGKVATRPLAGTRKRGRCPIEDKRLEEDLLTDEKERAEHLMLVDLARNDLGRVCVPGTVRVTELMGIEKYSKVMHIVSHVEGTKREDCTPLDVLRSAFPAGTVSGAPKVRAMEIIEELEPEARGPYAGAVGYMGFGGDMDMCIAIRTFLQEGENLHVQAGAGIVYDSVPEKEYEETKNKARALITILEGQRTKGVA